MAQRWWDLPPAAGSFVMATGIISIGLHLTGFAVPSLIALGLAGAVWLLLAVDFCTRLIWDFPRWSAESDTPPALTAVPATTVLGTRLALLGWHRIAVILLIVAAVVWPVLLVAVIGHWQRQLPGAAFLVCVSTQGLAVLAATLSLAGVADWLIVAALVLWVLGLCLYAVALRRFDLRQVWTGAGDQWVAAGALAISALAASKLVVAPRWTGASHGALRIATLVVLTLCVAWYLVLLVAEVARPRNRYDIRRWATVFPLGMTAVATLNTGAAVGIPAFRPIGDALLGIAVGAWLLTCAALWRARRPARS
ncbi:MULTISPECIES: tellurite resistance/C4-dicarboxylate transporter family protein [unclassified Nocardia]|uniref:tellurite resistance/C4-dicarboxylate transporter family protein n=1 Tax=unclassified Nocardia TaxID=2637762 RepID=UPI001CE4455A|nr:MULTISPECIES: tellurite resistance/C4-dicarboxylate transporter family protein [unclassified Nocardia]